MSVEIFASTRRYHENANTLYRQPVVEIRVAGRTFTTDCRSEQEATEAAQHISAEFERHYRDYLKRWG